MVEEPKANQQIIKRTDKPSRRACLNSAHMLIRCLLHFRFFFVAVFGCSYETFQLKFMCELRSFFFFTLLFWPLSCHYLGLLALDLILAARIFFFFLNFILNAPAFFFQLKYFSTFEWFFSSIFCGFSFIQPHRNQNKTIRLFANIQICSISTANVRRLDWFSLVWIILFLGFKKIPQNKN